MERILIFGGYVNTGRQLAEQLLRHTAVRLALAGRRLERAREKAARLNARFDGERVAGAYADEPRTLAKMRAFAAENGYSYRGK